MIASRPFRLPRLYAILDPTQIQSTSELEVVRELVEAGVGLIQCRDKQASSRQLYRKALHVIERVRGKGTRVVINDRADIALLTQASGVHLGQDDLPVEAARSILGPQALIGYSTHTVQQVVAAEQKPADYVAFGPIFATGSKENPDPVVGLQGLSRARRATTKPLVAIGGITLETVHEVFAAGADSVAVIRDLVGVEDVGARARQYLQVLESFA